MHSHSNKILQDSPARSSAPSVSRTRRELNPLRPATREEVYTAIAILRVLRHHDHTCHELMLLLVRPAKDLQSMLRYLESEGAIAKDSSDEDGEWALKVVVRGKRARRVMRRLQERIDEQPLLDVIAS